MPDRTRPGPADADKAPRRPPFKIGGEAVAPGARATVDLPISVLSDHTPISLTAHVVHGRRSGPTLFVSAAVHGDEIIGVEIIRRLLHAPALRHLRGTLICVPIVNVFGFITHDRYLPDRRDLNRSFPGSANGSLASQIAHLFTAEIIRRSDWGIDLHSASNHRINLPQIRISPSKPETQSLAVAFGAPVILRSKIRAGSLRETAQRHGVDVMTFEAGEALRFDEICVRIGVKGILRVMKRLGMVRGRAIQESRTPPAMSRSSYWVRAPAAGILRAYRTIGNAVGHEESIGIISDPLGEVECDIRAGEAGIVIGRTNLPVVHQGDALFHIARVVAAAHVQKRFDRLSDELAEDPLFDEDEIL